MIREKASKGIALALSFIMSLSGVMPYTNVYAAEPDTSTYKISINESDNGTVSTEQESANAGDPVTVTVYPDQGYVVDEILVEAEEAVELSEESENVFKFMMPASDVTITGKFSKEKIASKEKKTYTASIVKTDGIKLSSDKEKYTSGEKVTVHIDSGKKKLDYISVIADDESFIKTKKNGADYVFTMPANNVVIHAVAKEQNIDGSVEEGIQLFAELENADDIEKGDNFTVSKYSTKYNKGTLRVGYFEVDYDNGKDTEIPAMCIEHESVPPSVGTACTLKHIYTGSTNYKAKITIYNWHNGSEDKSQKIGTYYQGWLFRMIQYYGWGGPGEIDAADGADGYRATALALSVANGHNDNYYGYGSDLIKKIVKLADPPTKFTTYILYSPGGSTQDLAFWTNDTSEGKAQIEKKSTNESISANNKCYSLKGAVYGIYSDKDCKNLVKKLTTRADGTTPKATVDAGTYYVKEITAPKGFLLNTKVYPVTVKADKTTPVEVADEPGSDPIGIELVKADSASNGNGQGDASLAGAEFTIKYYDDFYTKDTLPSEATKTWVVKTVNRNGAYRALLADVCKVSGPDFYKDKNGNTIIPYGTISIEETKAPEGYTLDGAYLKENGSTATSSNVYVTQINDSTGQVQLVGGNKYLKQEDVITGGGAVQKYDKDAKKNEPQGDATLKGAEFTITNQSRNSVWVDADGNGSVEEYKPGSVITTLVTDENGYAATSDSFLPYGSYLMTETKAPEGYKLADPVSKTFQIREDGKVEKVEFNDPVVRGGANIVKYDLETSSNHTLGNGSLAGIKVDLINRSAKKVYVAGKWYEPGSVIATYETDENGSVQIAKDVLPYGTYEFKEQERNAGKIVDVNDSYLHEGTTEGNFQIREEGKIVDKEGSLSNQIKRGDFEIRKIDSENQQTMANVLFKITSVTTGETHYFRTDSNGEYASDGNYHSYRTNSEDDKEGFDPKDVKSNDGMWFGQYSDEEGKIQMVDVNDQLGALPYDLYQITEIKEDGINSDKRMWSGNLTISEDGYKVDMGDIENKKMGLSTTAKDQTSGGHYAKAAEKVTIVDTVEYEGLTRGAKYQMVGTLLDKNTMETVKDANGNEIKVTKDFTASKDSGTVDMTFTIDATTLGGHSLVVMEDCYDEQGALIAFHHDATDEEQTVTILNLHTTAVESESKDKFVKAGETMSITDTVAYEGLNPQLQYQVKGTLVDAETGKAVLDDSGKEILAETELFTPEESNGSVDVNFRFSGKALAGKTLVVFEKLYSADGKVLAAHEDPKDKDQTVYVPGLQTKAVDEASGSKNVLAGENTVIVDTVSYSNLIPGQEYTVKGILVNKETGVALKTTVGEETEDTEDTVDNTLYGTASFVPETASGTIDVKFTFNSADLKGTTLVAFETLSYNGVEIAVHKDLEDEGQTVYLPELQTEAKGPEGTKNILAGKDIEITDTISYKNLIPGQEYSVSGALMNRATGEAVAELESGFKFTPEKSEGTVDVVFKIDASELQGQTLVAYEELGINGKVVAEHKDLTDESQTIYVPELHTTAVDVDTKDHMSKASEKIQIEDSVEYKGLCPGKEYEVTGTLMDKKTGKALEADGKPITATAKFTPEKESGNVTVTFEFDGRKLAGQTLVAFEELTEEGKIIGEHKDLEDKDQTVQIPKIGTTATEGKDHEADAKKITIQDEVKYENLVAGKEYKVTGVLMDKKTKKKVSIDGKEVTATKKFKAEKESGSVTIEFTFDASSLGGRDVVAFETMTIADSGKVVATHEDINDKAQTVSIKGSTKKSGVVQTGDTVKMIVIVAALAVLIGGTGFYLKKKKK